LTPAYAGLLEPRGSGLKLLKSTFNAENFIHRLSTETTAFTLDEPIALKQELFHAVVQKKPSLIGTKFRHKKTRVWPARSKNFVILACTVLIQYSSMTGERTDRQT